MGTLGKCCGHMQNGDLDIKTSEIEALLDKIRSLILLNLCSHVHLLSKEEKVVECYGAFAALVRDYDEHAHVY